MLTDRRGALRAPAVCQFSWQFAIRYGMLLMTGFHTPVQPAERCLFAAAWPAHHVLNTKMEAIYFDAHKYPLVGPQWGHRGGLRRPHLCGCGHESGLWPGAVSSFRGFDCAALPISWHLAGALCGLSGGQFNESLRSFGYPHRLGGHAFWRHGSPRGPTTRGWRRCPRC